MVAPVSQQTLSQIATPAINAGDIAKSYLAGIEARQMKKARDQEMQMKQMQIQEYQQNQEVREKQRQASLIQLQGQIESLPQENKNNLQRNINESKQLRIEAFDLTLTDLGTVVRGAKSWRKWQEDHKDTLKDYFESDEQFEEFMKTPFTVQGKDELLNRWRANKPAMIDKRLEYEMQQRYAEEKARAEKEAEGIKPQTMDVGKQAATLQDNYDLEKTTADMVANKYSDLLKEGTPRFEVESVVAEAIGLLENAPWYNPFHKSEFTQDQFDNALQMVQSKRQYENTGTGIPMVDKQPGGKANPIAFTKEDTSWEKLPSGTHIIIDGKRSVVEQ